MSFYVDSLIANVVGCRRGLVVAIALIAAGCAANDEMVGTQEATGAAPHERDDVERLDKGGAVYTCFNWRASGWGPLGSPNSITADCLDRGGQHVTSEVWLPACVGNHNGNLIYGAEYFDRSCGNCGLHTEFRPERYRFVCDCQREDGGWQQTNLPISDYLTNIEGQLVCD